MAKSLAALRSSMSVTVVKAEPEPPARTHAPEPAHAPAHARAHEAEVSEADAELIEAGVDPGHVAWLNSQLAMGGYAAETAKDIIAKATGKKVKESLPQYSLPEHMRARKHRFYPSKG